MDGAEAVPAIFVVSDGRGQTCHQVVNAALVQFKERESRLVRCANVRTPAQVEAIVKRAANEDAIIFYTLVSGETRRAMLEASKRLLVPTVDILGPAFSALHDLFRSAPESKPGLLYESDREHFDRIEAIDYTLTHDDGQRPHELHEADAVLVGVSRAHKSATCFYLAYEGVRAANVPLILQSPPPKELFDLDPRKVVGLRINVMRLRTVREQRLISMGAGWLEQYVDKHEIAREVREANQLMEEHGWRSVDVSYKAVEEIAGEIMRLLGLGHSR
jgi:hypothetical protein